MFNDYLGRRKRLVPLKDVKETILLMIWSLKSTTTGQTKEHSQLIWREVFFFFFPGWTWKDAAAFAICLITIISCSTMVLWAIWVRKIHIDEIYLGRPPPCCCQFSYFFLTMGYHHLQNSYNPIQKLQKNLHTYAPYLHTYIGNVTFLNTYFFMM